MIHDDLIAEHGGSFGLRDLGLLSSALARAKNLYVFDYLTHKFQFWEIEKLIDNISLPNPLIFAKQLNLDNFLLQSFSLNLKQ